mmetsp:Transcript_52264/g.122349  ORF Transcript_52264/g.122349 Transcript_52264/m.122349 type:complete len:643 (-) Transcript_52264:178-2106(-)
MGSPAQVKGGHNVSSGGRLRAFAKTKLCKFNLIGACTRGSDCKFAHSEIELLPQPDLTCTKLCKAILETGECTDPMCSFAHRIEELRPTSAFFRTKMCQFHLLGHCRLGSQCNFAHSTEELREHLGVAALDPELEAELAQAAQQLSLHLQQQQQQQAPYPLQGKSNTPWQGMPQSGDVANALSMQGNVNSSEAGGHDLSFPSTPSAKPKSSRRSQASAAKKGRQSAETSAGGYSSASSRTTSLSSQHPGVLQGHWPDRRFDQCSSGSSSRDPVLDTYRNEVNLPNSASPEGRGIVGNVGLMPNAMGYRHGAIYANSPGVDSGNRKCEVGDQRSIESVVGAAVASVVAADRPGLGTRLEAHFSNLKGLLDGCRLDPASYAAGLETALSLGAANAAQLVQAVGSPGMRPVPQPENAALRREATDVGDTMVYQSLPPGGLGSCPSVLRGAEKQPLRLVRSAEGRLDLMGGDAGDDAEYFEDYAPAGSAARGSTWEPRTGLMPAGGPCADSNEQRASAASDWLGPTRAGLLRGKGEVSSQQGRALFPATSKGKRSAQNAALPTGTNQRQGEAGKAGGVSADHMYVAMQERAAQAANSGSMPDRRVSAYQGSSAKSSFANLSSQATIRQVRTADAALCTLAETVFEE